MAPFSAILVLGCSPSHSTAFFSDTKVFPQEDLSIIEAIAETSDFPPVNTSCCS